MPMHLPGTRSAVTIAASSQFPLLAAGSLPENPVQDDWHLMRIHRCCSPGLFDEVDCFYSPAAFASIGWSSPSAHTSASGLVAGGLVTGAVVLWYSDRVSASFAAETETVEKAQPPALVRDHFSDAGEGNTALLPLGELAGSDDEWEPDYVDSVGETSLEEGRSETPGERALRPLCMAGYRDNRRRLLSLKHQRAAAYFWDPKHTAPVRSVSFCGTEPHLLASAASGRLMLWDVSRIRSSTAAACWELLNASINISSLAWSPKPEVVGFTDGATAALLDLRVKEPLHSGARHTDRICSCIRFSPHNEHQIAVSCGDEYCFPSLLVWDVRHMNQKTPLRQFCDHSGGVRHISWSRNEDLILVGTNNKLQIWDPTNAAMISEEPISRPCDGAEWINTSPGRFVASFNREMTMYQLDGDSKTVSREGGSVKHRGWMEQLASE